MRTSPETWIGPLPLALAVGLLSLLLAACGGDSADTAQVTLSVDVEEEDSEPLVFPVQAASGQEVELEGTTWEGACEAAGGTDDVTTVFYFTFSVDGSFRGVRRWDAVPNCDTDDYVESTIALDVSFDGVSEGVTWEGGTAPDGLADSVTASRFIYVGDAGDGGFEFKTLGFMDDGVSPRQIYGTSEDAATVDADGYPTELNIEGLTEVTAQ